MIRPIVLLAAFAVTLGGCSALVETNLDADGCRPAMAIYQPPVALGGTGQVIHIPRSCPQGSVGMTPELAAALAQAGAGQSETAPGGQTTPPPLPPVSPVSAPDAVVRGVEGLCRWFLGGAAYSLEGLRAAAAASGYQRGAPVQIIPLPEMAAEPSYSALGFTAAIADPPSDGHGMAAFVSFHHPVCQIQVHGYRDEVEPALAELQARGWTPKGEPERNGSITTQRYLWSRDAVAMTMSVHRLDPEFSLGLVINVTPGDRPGGDLPPE